MGVPIETYTTTKANTFVQKVSLIARPTVMIRGTLISATPHDLHVGIQVFLLDGRDPGSKEMADM